MRKILGISLMVATVTMILVIIFLLRPIENKKSMISYPVEVNSE